MGLGIQVGDWASLVKIELGKQRLAVVDYCVQIAVGTGMIYNKAESDAGMYTFFLNKNEEKDRGKIPFWKCLLGEHYYDLHTAAYLAEPPATFPQDGFKAVCDYPHLAFVLN